MKTFEIDLDDTPERWQQLYSEVEQAILESDAESAIELVNSGEGMIWPYWSCA